jgi:hypothetical protein
VNISLGDGEGDLEEVLHSAMEELANKGMKLWTKLLKTATLPSQETSLGDVDPRGGDPNNPFHCHRVSQGRR